MQHYLLAQRASRPLTSTHIPRAARWRWLLPLLALLLGGTGSAWAQVTKTLPGDYATFTAAITDINANFAAGGVTVNVAAGYAETPVAALPLLTAQGTGGATGQIIFRKAGAGTNPRITAHTGSTSTTVDGIVRLDGADFVTFDGIDLVENPANITTATQMEFGYALFRPTTGNGCQNNTIRNCFVGLLKTNAATIGIAGLPHTSANVTAAAAASAAGANSNNVVTGNVVSNATKGIDFTASSATTIANYDQNNLVGVTAAGVATGNTVGNFGSLGTSGWAVGGNYQNGLKIANNTINSTRNFTSTDVSVFTAVAANTVTSTLRGIFGNTGASANIDITNNTITVASGAASSQLVGIENSIGSTAASNTVNITGNTVTNCTYTTATTGTFFGIANFASAATVNISNNTVTSNTTAGTGSMTLITGGSPATLNMNSNTISGNSKQATTGSLSITLSCLVASTAAVTATSNTITDNTIVTSGTSTSTGTVFGYSNGGGPVSETLTGNTITGLGISGTSTATGSAVSGIRCNTLSTDVQLFTQNVIGGLSIGGIGSGTVNGILFSLGGGGGSNIARNKIYDLSASGANGFVNGINITGGGTYPLNNNLIGDLRTPAATGLVAVSGLTVSGGTAVNAYFNTIHLNATSTGATFGTSGIFLNSTTIPLDARNNIVVNKSTPGAGAGSFTAALRRNSGTAGTAPTNLAAATNNNIYFAGAPSATNVIYVEGSATATNAQQTIAAYKAFVATRESNSVSEDVPFLSTSGGGATFLHINPAVATQAESGGQPVSGITTDFDGDTRNVTTPDIGADEGAFTLSDLSGPAIAFAPLANTSSTANRTLTATITDPSGVSTTAVPRLFYRKGTTGAFVSTPATGPSGSSYTFTFDYAALGGVTGGDVIQYYVVAQDGLGNVSSSPTGGSFSTAPALFFQYSILNTLSGTYYVSATAATSPVPARTFATLTAAAAAYNTNGLAGAVTFLLLDPTYSTAETFPVAFNNNPDASATNTLTIRPSNATGTTAFAITGTTGTTAGAGLIQLLGSDYVTLDGSLGNQISPTDPRPSRDLAVTNTSTTTTSAVIRQFAQFTNDGATFNTIKNLVAVGTAAAGVTGTLYGVALLGVSTATTAGQYANNTVQNVAVRGTQVGIASIGGTAALKNENVLITQNDLNAAIGAGALTRGGIVLLFDNNAQVTQNTVGNITNASDVVGISLGFGLSFSNATFTGSEVTNTLVSRNNIGRVTSTGTFSAVGIGVASAATGTTTVANNFVSGVASNGIISDFGAGIYVNGSAGGGATRVLFNSVSMTGVNPGALAADQPNFALAIGGSSPTVEVRNNVLYNAQAITGAQSYAIGFAYAGTTGAYAGLTSTNNAFFGTNGIGLTGSLATGTVRTTLADLNAETGQDRPTTASPAGTSLTLTGSPFVSATDLHTSAAALDGAGVSIAGITTDIDGETRNATTPDIGGDEFTPPSCQSVSGLAAGNITATSANITFTAPTTGSAPADYTVTYTPAGGTAVTVTPNPTASPVALTGLAPNTTYTVTVTTNCVGGGTSPASSVTFTTPVTPPANDACANAVALTSATSCVATAGTVAGATQSLAPILCNGTTSSGPAQDVFYSFTATGTTHTIAVTGTFDGVLEVLSGTCAAPTNVGCADATFGNNETLTLNSLTAGTTYLVRYYPFTANPANKTFTICVTEPVTCAAPTAVATNTVTSTSANVTFTAGIGNTGFTVNYTPAGGTALTQAGTASPVALTGLTPNTTYSVTVTGNCAAGATATSSPAVTFTTPMTPPANDNPAGAIAVSITADCTAPIAGTNVGATTTTPNGYANPGTAPANCGIAINPKDVFYTFTTDATGSASTGVTVSVTGVPASQIRVFSSAAGAAGPFTQIGCSSTSSTVAAPALALSGLTASTTYYVRISGHGSSDATGTFTVCVTSPPTCAPVTTLAASGITTTSANLTFTAGTGNTSYTVTYTPAGGTAQTTTGTASPIALTGLTPGTSYAVSVQPVCSGGGTAAASTISFTTRFAPPANDECANAVALTSATTCTPTTGSTLGATASAGVTGTCAGTADDDVWYSFVATNTSHSIRVTGNSGFDAVVNLRAGACPGTLVGSCQDANGIGGTETLVASGLTVGDTYLVRVYSFPSTTPSTTANSGFTICVTNPAPVCNAPTALATNSVTSTSANVTFTAGTGNTGFTATATPQGGGTAVTGTGTASPIALTGLAPNTAYNLSLQAVCAGGGTTPAVTTTFSTPATACGAPGTPSFAAITTSSASVSFTPSGTNVGPYTVTATAGASSVTATGAGSPISLTGLAAGTTYSVTVTGTCSAAAGGGTSPASAAASLTTATPPCDAPTALAAGSITNTSASVSFTASASATSYTVTTSPATTSQNVTASPVSLTGLMPGVTYTVSIVSNCAGGLTSSPATVTFTTTATCNAATALTPTGVTTSAATVNFTGSGSATSYTVTTSPATTNQTLPAGASSVSFSGLTQSTAYTVSIVSNCAGGLTATATTTFTTASPACNAPTAPVVSAVTSTSASVSFTASASAVSYTVTTSPASTSQTITGTTANLTGLSAGTAYTVSIVSNCAGGATSPAATATFTTSAPACNAPTALAAGSVTNTSATVSFTGSGTATGYTVTTSPATTIQTLAGSATSVSFTGLNPGVAYTVSIVSNCAGGVNSSPATVTFTTTATCNAATALTSASVTSTSATVNFTGSASATSYTVTTSPVTTNQTLPAGASSVSFSGLNASTAYTVSIVSNCAGGLTATATTTFTTTAAALTDLTVSTGQTISGSYNNVTITGPATGGAGVATLGGTLTVSGTLTIQNGGVLVQNCQTLNGPGNFVLAAGAELRICDPAGISSSGATGAVQLAGSRSFSNDASYTYNGTVLQATGSGLPPQVRNLTVNNNASGLNLTNALSVAQVVRLTSGDLNLGTRDLTLLSSGTGTALVVNTSGIVVGTATVQRYIDPSLNPGLGYRHYSAPVANTTIADLTTAGFTPTVNSAYNTLGNTVNPFPTVFGYDQARVTTSGNAGSQDFDRGFFSPTATTDAMTVGRGYTVNIGASELVDFRGTLNNGAVSMGPLARGTQTESGWQFLGNPYPSPLDWSTVAVPAGLNSAVYVFQSTTQYAGSYRSYQNGVGGNPLIASSQGFFVRTATAGATPTLVLDNANRVTTFTGANPAFNRGNDPRPLVQLTLNGANSAATLADPAYVYFEAGATAGVDARYDAFKIRNSGEAANLYALAGAEELSIAGLAPLASLDVVVPLGLTVPQAGAFVLNTADLRNFSRGTQVFLRDAQTGLLQDLSQQPRYSFAVAAGALTNTTRFALVFRPSKLLGVRAELLAAQVDVYPNPAHKAFSLNIAAVPTATTVRAVLYNALGQPVQERTLPVTATGVQAKFDVSNLATGVYLLRITAGEAQVTKRVVVE